MSVLIAVCVYRVCTVGVSLPCVCVYSLSSLYPYHIKTLVVLVGRWCVCPLCVCCLVLVLSLSLSSHTDDPLCGRRVVC